MGQLLQIGELLLLVLLAILQLGRWSKKTEDGPADAARAARMARTKSEEVAKDLREHKKNYYEFLRRRQDELDRTYARKREVELQLETITAKQDSDCDRITQLEERLSRVTGV